MKREERIERQMEDVKNIIDNCTDYNDGKQQLADYCKKYGIGCCRRGERCEDCPITKGKEKLAEMFGFEEHTAPVVVNVQKLTVKIGKVTINWIEK